MTCTIFNVCDHLEKVFEEMMTSNHYLGGNMDRLVINLADVTTDSDNGSSTETASMDRVNRIVIVL